MVLDILKGCLIIRGTVEPKLSTEEINQYQQIVIALTEILGLMQEIDRIIPGFPIE
ncbi:MAG: hypothetical protein ACK4YK_03935 [Dolichospermum sp.]|jgi:predicted secreted protein